MIVPLKGYGKCLKSRTVVLFEHACQQHTYSMFAKTQQKDMRL